MNPKDLELMGTMINYYFICKTKLWFFAHNIFMEQESDLVALGKLIHRIYYGREKKDLQINRIAVDFVRMGDVLEVHEVKKSSKMEKAHRYQLLYYMLVLSEETGLKVRGVINYPKLGRKVEVDFGEKEREEILKVIEDLRKIISMKSPPKPTRKGICRRCAYRELCWS